MHDSTPRLMFKMTHRFTPRPLQCIDMSVQNDHKFVTENSFTCLAYIKQQIGEERLYSQNIRLLC